MTPAEILKLVLVGSIVGSVFAQALRAHAKDALYLVRNPGMGLRAFVAIFVVVPIVALALVVVLDLRPPVAIALLVLSLSPIPPLLPKKQVKAGSEAQYLTGLLVSAAAASLIVLPVGMGLFSDFFGRKAPPLALSGMASTLGITIAAPLAAGLLAQALIKDADRREKLANLIGKVSMLVLTLASLALAAFLFPLLGKVIGGGALIAIGAMILAGLAAGWALGGPPAADKPALALAAASRHPGVAIGVILSSFPDEHEAALTVVVFLLVNAVLTALFVRQVSRANVQISA